MDVRAYAAVEALKRIPKGEYWYLASPYSKMEDRTAAAEAAGRTAGYLATFGITAFSPIFYSHNLCRVWSINPLDHDFWMRHDRPLMFGAYGCVVLTLPGWQDSVGIGKEIDYFEMAGRPVEYMQPMEGI